MAIAVRQETSGASIGTSSSTTLTSPALPSAALNGSGIEVCFLWNANATLPTSVTCGGQAMTYGGLKLSDANDGTFMAAYYLYPNTVTTAFTAVATFAAAQTFYGVPHIKEITGTSGWQGVTPVGQNQVNPGTGSNLISTTSITPTAQPCLASSYTYDDQGNAPSGTPSNVTVGVTDWISGATTFATLTTGSTRLTSTSAFASTFTNATDGAIARFLSMQTLWTESAGGAVPLMGQACL